MDKICFKCPYFLGRVKFTDGIYNLCHHSKDPSFNSPWHSQGLDSKEFRLLLAQWTSKRNTISEYFVLNPEYRGNPNCYYKMEKEILNG